MLSHFPQIRDEESTYSIFARLQFALQPLNFEVMGNMLFGRKFEVGRLNFQGSFDYLCSNLPASFIPETFLYKNTIYPLFIPFISEKKQQKAIEYFKGDYPDKINKCLRIADITKTRTYIRVCKECIREDFEIYGEPYYRRQHEIEINCMCLKHRTPLYEYVIFPYKIPSRYNDLYTVLNEAKQIEIPEQFESKFLDIADDISFIFTADLTGWNIEITKDKINNKMIDKGYITVNGLTYQKQFSKDFKEYYTEEFLEYIDLNFDIGENDSWLRHTTTRKKPVGNPLKYLLVIRYLFGSFKEFYEYKDIHSIFKNAPYPCLNKICPNYNKLVIHDCSINISHKHPLAIFKCEYCGFTYSRRGPDKSDNDIYKKTYVKDYGHLWYSKFDECIKQGFGIRKIQRILGSSSCQNIINYIDKYKKTHLNDCNPNKNNPIDKIINDETLLLDNYKAKLLQLLKDNPNLDRAYFNRTYSKEYRFILKHDRAWINNNIKSIKKKPELADKDRLIKYWLNKDTELSKEIIQVIDKLKSEKGLYERITIVLLQKYTGYYNLHINRTKLPKCFEIIDKECETIPKYQKRRVDFLMKQMADNSEKITFAKVLYNTCLRNRASQDVIRYIEEKVNIHNQGGVLK